MILVDTGPFVALFDPKDGQHRRCRSVLQGLREPLWTTIPVLTEAFHILSPESIGSVRLREFVLKDAVSVWSLDRQTLGRTFELMDRYMDHPMDLADASLVTAAEVLGTRRIFTLDHNDFSAYRIAAGRRHEAFEILA